MNKVIKGKTSYNLTASWSVSEALAYLNSFYPHNHQLQGELRSPGRSSSWLWCEMWGGGMDAGGEAKRRLGFRSRTLNQIRGLTCMTAKQRIRKYRHWGSMINNAEVYWECSYLQNRKDTNLFPRGKGDYFVTQKWAYRSSCHDTTGSMMSWECWDAGLVPSPTQWVKDPELLQLSCGLRYYSGSHLPPDLGAPYATGQQKKKKKKKKRKGRSYQRWNLRICGGRQRGRGIHFLRHPIPSRFREELHGIKIPWEIALIPQILAVAWTLSEGKEKCWPYSCSRIFLSEDSAKMEDWT